MHYFKPTIGAVLTTAALSLFTATSYVPEPKVPKEEQLANYLNSLSDTPNAADLKRLVKIVEQEKGELQSRAIDLLGLNKHPIIKELAHSKDFDVMASALFWLNQYDLAIAQHKLRNQTDKGEVLEYLLKLPDHPEPSGLEFAAEVAKGPASKDARLVAADVLGRTCYAPEVLAELEKDADWKVMAHAMMWRTDYEKMLLEHRLEQEADNPFGVNYHVLPDPSFTAIVANIDDLYGVDNEYCIALHDLQVENLGLRKNFLISTFNEEVPAGDYLGMVGVQHGNQIAWAHVFYLRHPESDIRVEEEQAGPAIRISKQLGMVLHAKKADRITLYKPGMAPWE